MISRITRAGIEINDNSLPIRFVDKLITRNKFCLLCIAFSLLYLFYFVSIGQIIPFVLLLAGVFLFGSSIVLNRYQKYQLSAILILVSTNYCVLFTSLFFGLDSGFHLYLLISPLIVFVLFSKEDGMFFKIAIGSYIATFMIVVLADKIYNFKVMPLTEEENDIVYLFNFLFAIILLIVLLLYFSYNNSKVNGELEKNNTQLTLNQEELNKEIQVRKDAEQKLLSSIKEKDILLAEVHHRVKNNLALVSALLELEAAGLSPDSGSDIIKISQNRIKAIALLHELQYKSESIELVSMKAYLVQLAKHLQVSLLGGKSKFNFLLKGDDVNLKFNRAMPFALILNELLIRSIKRKVAKGEPLDIQIHFERNRDSVILFYKDQEQQLLKDDNNCFSSNLIELLISQLNAEYEVLNKNGKIFKLRFKREL